MDEISGFYRKWNLKRSKCSKYEERSIYQHGNSRKQQRMNYRNKKELVFKETNQVLEYSKWCPCSLIHFCHRISFHYIVRVFLSIDLFEHVYSVFTFTVFTDTMRFWGIPEFIKIFTNIKYQVTRFSTIFNTFTNIKFAWY